MFTERRWERRHENGWTGVVVQTDADCYRAFALTPTGERLEAPRDHQNFESAKANATRDVQDLAGHDCRCPDWVEVPYVVG